MKKSKSKTETSRRARDSGGNVSERVGDWFLTFTAKKFWPLDARVEEVCIDDIAHALARICRFNGHCRDFYSVAQHSVIVSHICSQAPMQALLHDATEAYLGDMIRPLKMSMPDYREAEDRLWIVIAQKFGLAKQFHPEIKPADNIALMTERRDLCTPTDHRWSLQDKYPAVAEIIAPELPSVAQFHFMERFLALGGAR